MISFVYCIVDCGTFSLTVFCINGCIDRVIYMSHGLLALICININCMIINNYLNIFKVVKMSVRLWLNSVKKWFLAKRLNNEFNVDIFYITV